MLPPEFGTITLGVEPVGAVAVPIAAVCWTLLDVGSGTLSDPVTNVDSPPADTEFQSAVVDGFT